MITLSLICMALCASTGLGFSSPNFVAPGSTEDVWATNIEALPEASYAMVGDMKMCKIITSLCMEDYTTDETAAVEQLLGYQAAGLTAFEATSKKSEYYIKKFREKMGNSRSRLDELQFISRWCPPMEDGGSSMTKAVVTKAVDDTLTGMGVDHIDLLQFGWGWQNFRDANFIDALYWLNELKRAGKIRHVGVLGFAALPLKIALAESDCDIVSNRLQLSLPEPLDGWGDTSKAFCQEKGITVLGAGTLKGGFLTDPMLGRELPPSTSPYFRLLGSEDAFGRWQRLQVLLWQCKDVGDKHGVTIANVAMRWALDYEAADLCMVGARPGCAESPHPHMDENLQALDFELDEEDIEYLRWTAGKVLGG